MSEGGGAGVAGQSLWDTVTAFLTFSAPKSQKRKRRKQELPSGLSNQGNSCFLNAIIQALRSSDQFKLYLRTLSLKTQFSHELKQCVLDEVDNTSVLLPKLERKTGKFMRYYQQDSHELFNFFLKIIEDDVTRSEQGFGSLFGDVLPSSPMARGESELKFDKFDPMNPMGLQHLSLSRDPFVSHRFPSPFEGLMASFLRCTNCQKKSAIRHNVFNSVSLSIPRRFLNNPKIKCKLSHCLEYFTHEERVEGVRCSTCSAMSTLIETRGRIAELPENDTEKKFDLDTQEALLLSAIDHGVEYEEPNPPSEFFASYQEVRRPAIKHFMFARLPASLCLHINRLLPNRKLNMHVEFGERLSMRPYLATAASTNYESSFDANEPQSPLSPGRFHRVGHPAHLHDLHDSSHINSRPESGNPPLSYASHSSSTSSLASLDSVSGLSVTPRGRLPTHNISPSSSQGQPHLGRLPSRASSRRTSSSHISDINLKSLAHPSNLSDFASLRGVGDLSESSLEALNPPVKTPVRASLAGRSNGLANGPVRGHLKDHSSNHAGGHVTNCLPGGAPDHHKSETHKLEPPAPPQLFEVPSESSHMSEYDVAGASDFSGSDFSEHKEGFVRIAPALSRLRSSSIAPPSSDPPLLFHSALDTLLPSVESIINSSNVTPSEEEPHHPSDPSSSPSVSSHPSAFSSRRLTHSTEGQPSSSVPLSSHQFPHPSQEPSPELSHQSLQRPSRPPKLSVPLSVPSSAPATHGVSNGGVRGSSSGASSSARSACSDYRLAAVVEHSGSAYGGHFTTYRRVDPKPNRKSDHKVDHSHHSHGQSGEGKSDRKSKWVHISDNRVERVNIERVKGAQAYMLFYELMEPGGGW